MIVVDVEQGSQEWFAARCGIPSASNFDKIVTTTGAPSKQAKKYLYQVAVERVTGKTEETYVSAAMERGIEMESEARNLYELMYDVKVEQVGLCYPDEKKLYSCSPDGLVGEDGLLEIKCPISSTAAAYIIEGGLNTDYFQQCQGQLLVTGRQYVDLFSYYPGIKPHIIRIERDEKFLGLLRKELEWFCEGLDAAVEKIK